MRGVGFDILLVCGFAFDPHVSEEATRYGNLAVLPCKMNPDPTTGEIRSASTDDIACWLIDTNYNGESFFVRHAYFTGADEPDDKLKRALRADIDEDAWRKRQRDHHLSVFSDSRRRVKIRP